MNSKVLSIIISATICSTLTTPSSNSLHAQTTSSHCQHPVARLLNSGDIRYQAGAELCANDRIQSIDNKILKLVCRNQKYVTTSGGLISQLCQLEPASAQEKSNKGQHLLTIRGDIASDRVKRPFGNVLIENRPVSIQWDSVEGATEYQVQVEGYNLKWNRFIKGSTNLLWPESAPPLNPGQVYKISITAYSPESAIQHVRSSYQILSNETAAEIKQAEQLITDLRLPISQEAKTRDSLYMAFKLLNRSIETLEHAVEKGADQSVRRLLIKRYADAGYPELAKTLLSSEKASYSQLPDKIKPLQ